MSEQRNLTEENVDELKEHLDRMKIDNPELEYNFFPQEDAQEDTKVEWRLSEHELLQELIEKVDKLDRNLKLIFDGHVLIKSQFIKHNIGGK